MNVTTKALAHNAAITAIAILTGAAVMALAAVILATGKADSHEAIPTAAQPLGWQYPWACCANQDCQRLDRASVHETKLGYVVDPATDVAAIGYHDKRVKDSPDGDFHWCAHPAGIDAGHTICLFVPPKGF